MKKLRRVQIARVELTKIKRRLEERNKAQRTFRNYFKSFSPKPNSFNRPIQIEIANDSKILAQLVPKIIKKPTIKLKKRALREVKLPTMRGKQLELDEGNFQPITSKYEEVKFKPVLKVNTTENRKQRRNLKTCDIQNPNQTILYTETQNKLLSEKENNIKNEKKRMLSPFYQDRKLLGVNPPDYKSATLENNKNHITPNTSVKHNRYSKIAERFQMGECESPVPNLVINYIQDDQVLAENKCEKKRNFYKNIKLSKGKYSTFFEELTNATSEVQNPGLNSPSLAL